MTNDQRDAMDAAAGEAPHVVMRDAVTGLANRKLFDDRLMVALSLAKRNDWLLAVLFIQLDQLKQFDDDHGQAIGDRARQAVAARLSQRARGGDTVSHAGDDELLYLLVNPDGRENTRRVVQRIRDRLAQPVVIESRELVISPRIGIALYPGDGAGVETLIARARIAMHEAASRHLSYLFFDTADIDADAAAIEVGTAW